MAATRAKALADELRAYAVRSADSSGGCAAVDPGHRKPFHWPPHPESYSFHVLASDWKGSATFEAHGETFDVDVAKTPYGVFGRCRQLWHEAHADTEQAMLKQLAKIAEPLFVRQFCIAATLERPGRFTDHIRDLEPLDLLKLLYCADRDVANEARIEIETHASLRIFADALIAILNDRTHPHRRSAQWCVLDLFEDIRSFCDTDELETEAILAMKSLIESAEDDYARTIYKAGVVLGGHIPGERGGPVLIECLKAPSKIGRRAAIHGLFHVVEWDPSFKPTVVAALGEVAAADPEPTLRQYAASMAADIANENLDHVDDPPFPEEQR